MIIHNLELLVYLFAAAFVSWLCATRRNVGMVIVMYIAIVLGCTMVAGILQIVIVVLQSTSGSETTIKILDFIQRINIFNSSLITLFQYMFNFFKVLKQKK